MTNPFTTPMNSKISRGIAVAAVTLVLMLIASGPGFSQSPSSAKQPISKDRLLKALGLNALPPEEFVERVQQQGVDFQLTPDDAKQLMEAGATLEVLQAVRDNYRGNATQSPGSGDAPVEYGQPPQQTVQEANTSMPPVSDVQSGSAQASNTPVTPEVQAAATPKKKSFLQKFNEKMEKVNKALDEMASKSTKKPSPANPNTAPPAQTGQPSNAPATSDGPVSPITQPADASATGNTASSAGSVEQTDKASRKAAKAARKAEVSANDNAAASTSSSAPENLAGTYWSLVSMTTKGETEKESGSPPDVEFCRNGSWGMLHYGGAREAGKYQVQGSRLIMKMEDGSLYGNFQIKRNGNEMILDDGKYVLRLKYRHQAGC